MQQLDGVGLKNYLFFFCTMHIIINKCLSLVETRRESNVWPTTHSVKRGKRQTPPSSTRE
jgi:hypothetical protein